MIFRRFRRRSSARSGASARSVEQPAIPSPRPHAGELGRSELAEETEAFLHGSLAEHRAANGGPLAAWMVVNRVGHGDPVDIFAMAAGDVSRPSLARVSSSYLRVWNSAQRSIATRLLERAPDPEAIREVQRDSLVPLELDLIAESRDEPLTFAEVITATLAVLDRHHLDR